MNLFETNTKAQICPVCNGSGRYREEYNFGHSVTSGSSYTERTCHGCGGKGYIIIPTFYQTNIK